MTTTTDHNASRASSGPESPEGIGRGPLEADDASPGGEQDHGQTGRRATQRRRLQAAAAVAVTLAIVGGAALGLFVIDEMEGEISVKAFEDVIRSWGHWGILASIGLMVLHSFVPFPAELVALANGMLYGPVWGTVITWTGAMLGAFLAFGLSRFFGRPFVDAMVARRHWQRLDTWTAENGAQMVFFARFLPVISFNLVNYAAGLMRISWWTFGWTTGLGILPVALLMAVLGDQADKIPWQWWGALLIAAAAGWLAIQPWRHRRRAEKAVARQTESFGHRSEIDRKQLP